ILAACAGATWIARAHARCMCGSDLDRSDACSVLMSRLKVSARRRYVNDRLRVSPLHTRIVLRGNFSYTGQVGPVAQDADREEELSPTVSGRGAGPVPYQLAGQGARSQASYDYALRCAARAVPFSRG